MELKIQIENFKSVRSVQLPLRKGLNVLLGPNGSGKTCILSSLKFLGDILRFGVAQALARSGGAKRVYHRRKKEMFFSIEQSYGQRTFKRKKCPFNIIWEIRIAQRGPEKIATIVLETLKIIANSGGKLYKILEVNINRGELEKISTKVWLSQPDYYGRDLFKKYWGGVRPKSSIRENVLISVREYIKHIKKNGDISLLGYFAEFDISIADLYRKFTTLDEYSIVPDIARKPTEQLRVARMQPDGSAVSEVIHALENKHFNKIMTFKDYYEPLYFKSMIYEDLFYYPPWHRWRRIHKREIREITKVLSKINRELAIAVKPIESVCVEIEQTTGKRGLVFLAGKEKFYPEEVSDGTIKWLCILVSILVSHSNIYLLEEPENFLHPWMQQRLIGMMRREAKSSETIFIVASHSSTILNSAKPEEVLIIKQSSKGTEINEIEDRSEIEKVLSESDFGLGDLWVSGALGGVPSDG